MGARLLLPLTLLALGCQPSGPLPPVSVGDCAAAGDTLERLGCAEATTPGGAPFSVACAAAARDGRDWHPECIAAVTSCSQVEAAYRGTLCGR